MERERERFLGNRAVGLFYLTKEDKSAVGLGIGCNQNKINK